MSGFVVGWLNLNLLCIMDKLISFLCALFFIFGLIFVVSIVAANFLMTIYNELVAYFINQFV